jgi:glycosyltransferase involved in cell wall biosynthesis
MMSDTAMHAGHFHHRAEEGSTHAPPSGNGSSRAGDHATSCRNGSAFSAALIGPRFRHDPNWPWLSRVSPLDACPFTCVYITNTFDPIPKLTFAYRWLQYFRAIRAAKSADIRFIFSDDVATAVTGWLDTGSRKSKAIYVGFTQDDAWSPRRIERARRFFPRFSAVTVFTEEERQIYIPRFSLDPARVHVIPIHTDEVDGYRQYPDTRPIEHPYAVALGSPNRQFTPTARICRELGVPLVIVTRPKHTNDSLSELRSLGATVVTDANKLKSLTLLKHAQLAVMPFKDPGLPGGYTTIVHAMFLKTPIVATECVGVREHIFNAETGFVTAHGDHEALRDAIGRLWRDRSMAERFGEQACAHAQRTHSLEAAARKFYDLAREIIDHEVITR